MNVFRSPFSARLGGQRMPARVFDAPNGGSKAGEGGNKFGAKAMTCTAGHSHPSKAEARRCNDLHLMQRGGIITDLEVQPQFWFIINGEQVKHEGGRRVGYKADFAYREQGRHVVEESKPAAKAARGGDYPLRKAIFLHLFPHIDFREVQ
jgi:hypothetical protein